jgi:hypothetical protein
MSNPTDNQAQRIGREREHAGEVISHDYMPFGLICPHSGCEDPHSTHVVDVVWEEDPGEGDRRLVRMEVRCENGHGYMLLVRNHGGTSCLDYRLLDDVISPFAEGAKW